MVRVGSSGLTDKFTMGSGWMIGSMEVGSGRLTALFHMLENGNLIKLRVLEYWLKDSSDMKVSLWILQSTGMGLTDTKTDKFIQEDLRTTGWMDKASIIGRISITTKGIFWTINVTERELYI